jgi:competence protein ComEC
VLREPLLLPAAALATGIVWAHFFYFRLPDLTVPACLTVMALIAATFVVSHWARLLAVCTAIGLGGIATQVTHRQDRTPRLNADDAETVLLSGCVTNPPVFSPQREQFTLQLAPKASARMSVVLQPGETAPALLYGQRIEAAAKIHLPRNYQNPDAFDYAGYLAAQHIYWTGSVSSPSDIRQLPGGCGFRPLGWIYTVRTWALARLTALYPDDRHTAALLAATLLGVTSGVERRWTNDFRVTGTYHALVISGLHVSVLALTILAILRVFQFRRLPALGIATATSWLYAVLCGFNSPVVRSAAGFTFFFVSAIFFRKARLLNVLAAIGLIYLTLDPDQLFDPAFQLSFLSAAAIAAFAIPAMERFTEPLRASVKRFDQVGYDPLLEPRAAQWRVELRLLTRTLCSWSGLPEPAARFLIWRATLLAAFAAEAVIVAACIQFALALPMIAFHRLSATGLSANVLIVPLLAAVIPLGFASILTGWHALALLTKLLLVWSEWLAGWHVHFEPAWRMAALPLSISIAFALSLILLGIAIRRAPRFLPAALACSLLLFGVICWQPWTPDLHPAMLELTAIDVNQGDSLLLAFPDGETMLVDAGGFPGMERMARKPQVDVGEDVVSPYLWSRRIRHLDYAALTHGHSDHMGGLPAILDNFRPRALWIGAEPETAEWRAVQQHAASDHVPIVALHRSSTPIRIGGADIRVLAPAADYLPGDTATNNDSLVLEVTYRRRSILLTGDAEKPIEYDMIANAQLRPVTLLKVGHHGSRTSSSEEFLNQVAPQFAIISDGFKNQFHHPHPDVLARLAAHHTAVFRTDQRGLVTFLTDGDKVEIHTYR